MVPGVGLENLKVTIYWVDMHDRSVWIELRVADRFPTPVCPTSLSASPTHMLSVFSHHSYSSPPYPCLYGIRVRILFEYIVMSRCTVASCVGATGLCRTGVDCRTVSLQTMSRRSILCVKTSLSSCILRVWGSPLLILLTRCCGKQETWF
jgi:hypothetical protein